MKVGNPSKPCTPTDDEKVTPNKTGSWRQAIFNRVVTPQKPGQGKHFFLLRYATCLGSFTFNFMLFSNVAYSSTQIFGLSLPIAKLWWPTRQTLSSGFKIFMEKSYQATDFTNQNGKRK